MCSASNMDQQRRWSDLVPDVLREISSRFCSATDLVYFHAVCKPWRNSRDPLSRETTTKTQFRRPCILGAANHVNTDVGSRRIFSKSCYREMSPRPAGASRNWVAAADGTQLRFLTVKHLGPTLHDPSTGEFAHLPQFPYHLKRWEEENPRGIIYSDGTIFLYSLFYGRFTAALLRPHCTEWRVVERILIDPTQGSTMFCAAYYGGKILVSVYSTSWHILTLDDARDVLVLLPDSALYEREYNSRHYSFLVESRGELLWAFIQVERHWNHGSLQDVSLEYDVSFWLHALDLDLDLEEETSSARDKKKKMPQWVVLKDGPSLADRVLFLGTPNSFAVDASTLHGRDGGCAYFVLYDFTTPSKKIGVWRCNLISNKAEFIDTLPDDGWNDGRCTWHVPQPPNIAPVQDLMKAREELKQQAGLAIRNETEGRNHPSVAFMFSESRNRNTQKYVVPARRNEQTNCCQQKLAANEEMN